MDTTKQNIAQKRRTRIGTLALLFMVLPLFASASPDTEAVKSLLLAKSTAWANGDAGAWGKNYSEDSVLINIYGSRFASRATNIERHAKIFEGLFKGSSLKVDFERIEPLSEKLVLAETVLSVTGYETLPAEVPEAKPDTLQTRMTFILEHDTENGWQIIFAQNTAIVAP